MLFNRALLLAALLLPSLSSPAAAQEPLAAQAVAEQARRQPEPDQPQAPFALESPDPQIAERLRGLFGELDGLEGVRVDVSSGVVTLSGTALSPEDRQKAESIAGRLAGVVSVENELVVEHRVGVRLAPMLAKTRDIVRGFIAQIPLILIALLAFLAIWLVGRLLTGSNWVLKRVAPNPLVRTLIGQMIRLVFIVVGLILAMRILGATALLGSVLGAAGVASLAVGFAVRDTIENYIASILLSIRRPFAPNDHVIIEGFEGRVTRLNSRATFLTSLDGSELRIPNAIVYKAKITNYTRIPERRFTFRVGIGYENDICRAQAVALTAARKADGVLASPEPLVLVDSLDESTVALRVHGWVDLTRSDFEKVRSGAIRAVKTAFDDEAISMPAPIQIVQSLAEAHVKPAPSRHRPSKAAEEEVEDTSVDHTISKKVDQQRSAADEDLLSPAAPRE